MQKCVKYYERNVFKIWNKRTLLNIQIKTKLLIFSLCFVLPLLSLNCIWCCFVLFLWWISCIRCNWFLFRKHNFSVYMLHIKRIISKVLHCHNTMAPWCLLLKNLKPRIASKNSNSNQNVKKHLQNVQFPKKIPNTQNRCRKIRIHLWQTTNNC